MALIDLESCAFSTAIADFFTYGRFSGSSSTTSVVTVGGPLGDPYISSAVPAGGSQNRNLSALFNAGFFGARVQAATAGSTATGIWFADATGVVNFGLLLNTNTGVINVYRGTPTTTLIGSSAGSAFPFNSFFYLEVGFVISTTVGTVTVKVNGNIVLSLTGINNQATGNNTIAQIQFRSNTSQTLNYTHYYFCDTTGSAPLNTFLGDVRVYGAFPTANSAVQFTPNGLGSNFQNAAKVPPVPLTDFNSDSVIGDVDLFTLPATPASTTTVLGTQLSSLAYKSTAGSRALANEISSSGTVANGATISLGTSPFDQRDIFALDPNGNIAFTPTSLNALLIGYKVAS